MNDVQAGDAAKITDVARSNGVAEFERASSDDEIGHRNSDSLCGLLRAASGDDFGGRFGDGMNWDLRFQFIEELTALPASLRRIGAIYAVTEFRHRQRTDDDGNVACGFADFLDRLGSGELLS